MEIIRPSDHAELIDLALGSDENALRPMLEALPGWAHAMTERSEPYWQQQQSSVWSRISSSEQRPTETGRVRRWPLLAGLALASMILLAGFMLHGTPVVPPPQALAIDPDHELLVAVERAVHDDGPTALEPAALLAEEMVQDIAAHSPVRKKESTHEN